MRLATTFVLSAVLLSGCAMPWTGSSQYGQQNSSAYQYQGQGGAYGGGQACGNAAVYMAAAGCQDTVHASGFPQEPQFGNTQYITGEYGTHADSAAQHQANYALRPKSKPRWRGQLSLGFEKSNSGNLFNLADSGFTDPTGAYDPTLFDEISATGSIASGLLTTTKYSAIVEQKNTPPLSFDDVHSTPLTLRAGGEYILNPSTTLFANVGYSYSEGEDGLGSSVTGTLTRTITETAYDPASATPTVPLAPPTINTSAIPNQLIATFNHDFSDMHRVDLNIGARKYFAPLYKDQLARNLSPFVSAGIGVSHHNSVRFKTDKRQLFYQEAFENSNNQFFDVVPTTPTTTTTLYDAQWVPTGELLGGLEWQATGKTAIAVETGLRFEGQRDYVNGNSGDVNIAIPLTIRGSYNF